MEGFKNNIDSQIHGHSLYSCKVSRIINACNCSKNMIVAIYLMQKECFLYQSDAFKKIIGEKRVFLSKHGWDFWFSMIDIQEKNLVKRQFNAFSTAPYRRNSCILKYHLKKDCGEKIFLRHEIAIYKLKEYVLGINYFFDISLKERIEHCLELVENYRRRKLSNILLDKVSPREKEVLKLVADGYSSKQIADKLFISNHTAISHRKNLIEKFDVKNTAQLIKKASRVVEELW